MSKLIQGVIVGLGNRGEVYADYSLQTTGEFKVIAVVDPNPFKLQYAQEKYHLTAAQVFASVDDFLKAQIPADIVINATMDQQHYETALPLLKAKYNLLIEKPIVPNNEQLEALHQVAKENNCLVFVCHVLRYTMFYRTIKQWLLEKKIGDIVTMELNEHVCLQHYLSSYLRGKWNNEKECGSGLMLAKSCHDLDIICWLNNSTVPTRVCSFGDRKLFIKENKPAGATAYCYQCPHQHTCPLSSVTLYEERDTMPFLVYDKLNKPLDQISHEEKVNFLHQDIYGQCAYDIESDLVDRQASIIEFANKSTATFTLVGCATEPNRYIHIVGSHGEIEGKIEQNRLILRTYEHNVCDYQEEVIDLSDQIINLARFGGHNGGDYLIMHDLCAYLNGDRSSISITSLDDSLNGHRCAYALEESRKQNKIVTIKGD